LLSTKISIHRDGIAEKNILKVRQIRWEDVLSIEKKKFYVMMPDFEKPTDIEIIDKNKNAIRVYRFLHDFDKAGKEIREYSKVVFRTFLHELLNFIY
jgi:hypothetical protein